MELSSANQWALVTGDDFVTYLYGLASPEGEPFETADSFVTYLVEHPDLDAAAPLEISSGIDATAIDVIVTSVIPELFSVAGVPRGIHASGDHARYIALERDGIPAAFIIQGLSGDLGHALAAAQPILDSVVWGAAPSDSTDPTPTTAAAANPAEG